MRTLLLAVALGSAAVPTAEDVPARVTLKLTRVVDARESRVVDLFRAESVAPDERRVVWLVHGLAREDLFVRCVRRAGEDGRFGEAARYEVWLADRTRVVLERPGNGERISARGGEERFLYFDEDLGAKTVRCALKRLSEAADPLLLSAVQEYGRLKEVLETRDLEDEEYPVYVLWRVEEPPPVPVPPAWALVASDPDGPALTPLSEAARAALESE